MNETKLTKPLQLTEAIHQVHPIDNLRDLLDISFKKYPNNDAFRYKDKTTGNIISKMKKLWLFLTTDMNGVLHTLQP